MPGMRMPPHADHRLSQEYESTELRCVRNLLPGHVSRDGYMRGRIHALVRAADGASVF